MILAGVLSGLASRVMAEELAAEIARFALAREESRGCHRRADLPDRDPQRDLQHLLRQADGALRWDSWE
jgi:aspartate oxidase